MHSVLIIDDEKQILQMFRQVLPEFGFAVETAGDGKEGIQKFDRGCFDLVITDVLMPGIGGIEVAQYIRNSRKNTPVIGISGTPWLLKDTDFDSVISKPFPITTLVDYVKNLTNVSVN